MEGSPTNQSQADRSAPAYVIAFAVVCAVLLLVVPAALIPLGGIALAALIIVWAKAGLRTGRWFWMRPTSVLGLNERATWTASLVILAFGILAAAYSGFLISVVGAPLTLSFGTLDRPVGTKAVSYADSETQAAVKRALEAAGVRHSVETKHGKEWISWAPKDNDAAEHVVQAVVAGPLTAGRNVSFGDSTQQENFETWLTTRGVQHKRITSHGKSFVVWEGNETSEKLMEAFHRDQSAHLQTNAKDCLKDAGRTTIKKAKKGC
jgi:hypothetical protein